MEFDAIVRGTTPTIRFKFGVTNVENIDVAFLTIKQLQNIVITKDLTNAIIDPEKNTIEWTLTQSESLKLSTRTNANVVCDFRTIGGIRGQTKTGEYVILPAGKSEVI